MPMRRTLRSDPGTACRTGPITIAPVGLQQFFNPFDFLGCLVRQQVEADPTVAVLGNASQCRIALAAEPHRDAFAADRLRVAQHIREIDELALMRVAPLRPELAHDFDILARALTTTLERDAQSLELFRQPSDTNAEDEAAVTQPVD